MHADWRGVVGGGNVMLTTENKLKVKVLFHGEG